MRISEKHGAPAAVYSLWAAEPHLQLLHVFRPYSETLDCDRRQRRTLTVADLIGYAINPTPTHNIANDQ